MNSGPKLPPRPYPEGGPWLNRREVAKKFGVTYNAVRAMEQRGLLQGHRWLGVVYFLASDVASLTRRPSPVWSKGRRAAFVFRRFREGATTSDVVEELQEDPRVVARLYRAHLRDRGGLVLNAEHLSMLAKAGLRGTGAEGRILVEDVLRAAKRGLLLARAGVGAPARRVTVLAAGEDELTD